eukprot:5951706-Amphidinium_carterae.1
MLGMVDTIPSYCMPPMRSKPCVPPHICPLVAVRMHTQPLRTSAAPCPNPRHMQDPQKFEALSAVGGGPD